MSTAWALPECFRVRVTLQSDWHVGRGAGRPGHVDRLIARDADGLPFIPAKTLKGMWRDACERLCWGLDDGRAGAWSLVVDRLFGSQPALAARNGLAADAPQTPARESPIESALTVRAARFGRPLRAAVTRDSRLAAAMVYVKPGVKIDARSGAAQDDHLRFEEMARSGAVLEADCRLAVPPNARELASALLLASAQLIERLGGKRRRGAGHCQVMILGAQHAPAVEWLERHATPPPWPAAVVQPRETSALPGGIEDDGWLEVPLALHLRGPLAVAYRTVGNVVESLDFLPGTCLLPHASRVLSGLGVPAAPAIRRGAIVVLPATVEVDGERGVPVPLAWFASKEERDPLARREALVNRLAQDSPDEFQLRQLRAGYIHPVAPQRVVVPAKVVQTHNTIEDQAQRPTSDVGGVYTYEALAASEAGRPVRLRGAVRLRKSLAAGLPPGWWSHLDGVVSVGRSRKDDYGEIELKASQPREIAAALVAQPGVLHVWVLTDTVIRDDELRFDCTADGLGKELGRRLGVTLTLARGPQARLSSYVRARRLESWHTRWGLPRGTLVAIQAGSCMAYQVAGAIDSRVLAELEAGGIGERTAEGLGQIRFNDPLLVRAPADWPAPPPPEAPPERGAAPAPLPEGDPALMYARLIESECWKQEIVRACLGISGDAGERMRLLKWTCGGPAMSQLGGLRGQLASLTSERDFQAVLKWLDHLARNARRRDRWPAESIESLRRILVDRDRIWQILPADDWPYLTAGGGARLRGELRPFAVRALLHACMRAHKRDLESREAVHGA